MRRAFPSLRSGPRKGAAALAAALALVLAGAGPWHAPATRRSRSRT